MTSQQILQSDLLDILFEKRNKAYGAYLLRKTYPVQLLKAMGATALLVLLLLLFGNSSPKNETVFVADKEVKVTSISIQKEKPELPNPKMQPPVSPQRVKQETFVDKIKILDRPENPVATQDKLAFTAIGNSTDDGPSSNGLQPPAEPSTGGGTGAVTTEPEKKEPPLPSRQPQFPGGASAWLSWLNRYLMPPADLEPGEKRSVLVRFWVDEEGAISNFQVVQSGGADFDNEVIRALKRMPRWLPAIQNGRPVAVSFTQPVTFQASE